MKTEHTPAPWIISELNGAIDGEEDILIEHEGFPLATVRGTNDMSCFDDDEQIEETNRMVIANARLIAAAPDLLELLQDLVKQGGGGNGEGYAEVAASTLDAAEKLIEQITGSTHNTVNK
jgi:hypothetical protein